MLGKPPDAFDLGWRGLALVVCGPFIALFVIVALPFIAIGWLTHRLGWTVEHDDEDWGL